MPHWTIELVVGALNLVAGVLMVNKVHDHFYPRQNVAHMYFPGKKREKPDEDQSDSDKDE